MTIPKALNVFIFQWFFVRLTKHTERRADIESFISFDLMPNGSIGSQARGKIQTFQWYSIQFWIIPLSGWGSDFMYVNKKPKSIKISKEKHVV